MARSKTVLFIAFLQRENLGVGHIASVLMDSGFAVRFVDVQLGSAAIVDEIKKENPIMVGFSVIFQYHIDAFRNLIHFLREEGVSSHFCAGGHFPTLRYTDLLSFIPGLDSICLFEGEHTCRELAQALYQGEDWSQVRGLAYHDGAQVVTSAPRPLEADMDSLPIPVRTAPKPEVLGRRIVSMLAGRGCCYNCSFCSIRRFYSAAPGPLKRVRSPKNVVNEMRQLYTESNCSIFLFQDDDFPLTGRRGKRWATDFCRELARAGLADRVLWKISCRPNEIDEDLFAYMKDHGLFLAYLGIESGNATGLATLNKRLTKDDSLRAMSILDRLGILVEYGFMLIDPSSTKRSVRSNLRFLGDFCAGGRAAVGFCKMLPYAGTPIEKELEKKGRLVGDFGREDYYLLSSSLDDCYTSLASVFSVWLSDPRGVLERLCGTRLLLEVASRSGLSRSVAGKLRKRLRRTTDRSNKYILSTSLELLACYRNQHQVVSEHQLQAIGVDIARKQASLVKAIHAMVTDIQRAVSMAKQRSVGDSLPDTKVPKSVPLDH